MYISVIISFFFFKQKTAYEMRIRDWSSECALPIDHQVQINVRAPALSPELVEKQVSFPIETALAGTHGLEYTRSLSRNGFAQITAVFSDATDIYFARQQVGERLQGVQEN